MGKIVDNYIFNDWLEYLLVYVNNDFEIPKDGFYNNFILNSQDGLFGTKDAAIHDLRQALGMPYSRNKTSFRLSQPPIPSHDQFLKEYAYFESYLDNKEILLNLVKQKLGLPTKDSSSLNKEVFLKGLEDLLEKTNPEFLGNLQEYLSKSEFLLNDLKKYLGIPDEDNTFDAELSILCKSGYARLFEMLSSDGMQRGDLQNYLYQAIFEGGVPYLGNMIEVGKEWLYLYVKLSFDPPTASTLTYLKERLNELEWYIVNYNLGDWIYGEQKHAGDKTSWD